MARWAAGVIGRCAVPAKLINAMRAHLAELGLVAQTGREGVQQLMRTVAEADNERLPSAARMWCEGH